MRIKLIAGLSLSLCLPFICFLSSTLMSVNWKLMLMNVNRARINSQMSAASKNQNSLYTSYIKKDLFKLIDWYKSIQTPRTFLLFQHFRHFYTKLIITLKWDVNYIWFCNNNKKMLHTNFSEIILQWTIISRF